MSNPLNITKAAFGGLREVTTAPLWQYDYGQILQITGLDLPQAFEVHFSNSRKSGETITQIGTDGQVTIPDMFLTSGADVYCFIFLHDGLTDGETEYVIKIPVRERPEPSDIEPTPQQQDAITEAIAALNTAVTQTGQDVVSADASAQAAAQSATNAQTAAQSAQASATSASGSATTASNAAATATTKANEAATSATSAANAKTAAETAQGKAEAAQSASESAQASAESSAQTATNKAFEAFISATNASGSASAASASATTASESATNAAASATAASASATAAAGSATTASTKASEASASATAASNAQTAAETAQGKAEDAQTAAEAARNKAEEAAASVSGALDDKADVIIRSVEGSLAHFEDGGDDMPMVSCVAKIEPVQSGSGDPSPSNVRPISGWSAANVTGTGKNLFDKTDTDTTNGYAPNKYISSTNVVMSNSLYNISEYIQIKGNTQYTLNPVSGSNPSVCFYDSTKAFISGLKYNSGPLTAFTFTTPSNAAYIRISIPKSSVDALQIELGSTASDFEPYTGTTYPISWQSEAGTVYGGYVDLVSGVLTVDMAMVDLGELTFSATNTANIFYAGISDMRAGYSAKIVCEAYKRYSAYYTGMPDKSVANNSTYGYIYIKDTDYSDADTFMASLSGIYLAYEIKNPTTVQLTPHEVSTLLGLNNLWADTGDVEVQYRADTKLYIDGKGTDFSKLIAPTETDYTATRAYTSGSLLIVGNQLYKATTAIANGATLTVGTNITATTLAEVIAAL